MNGTIQVSTLKYPVDSSSQVIVVDPPLGDITTLPATDATILYFADSETSPAAVQGEMCYVNDIEGAETGQLRVQRGSNGSWAYGHAAGTKILAGPPTAFVEFDPSGACTPGNDFDVQLVNELNGNLWLCSTETSTWQKQSY